MTINHKWSRGRETREERHHERTGLEPARNNQAATVKMLKSFRKVQRTKWAYVSSRNALSGQDKTKPSNYEGLCESLESVACSCVFVTGASKVYYLKTLPIYIAIFQFFSCLWFFVLPPRSPRQLFLLKRESIWVNKKEYSVLRKFFRMLYTRTSFKMTRRDSPNCTCEIKRF